MRQKGILVQALFLPSVLVVIAVYWFGMRQPTGTTLDGVPFPSEQVAAVAKLEEPDSNAPTQELPPGPDSRRSPSPASAIEGQVVSSEGSPIEGACISWTAWTNVDSEWEPAWQRDDWGELDRADLETSSDSSGHFAYAAALEHSPSVLWATHDRFEAAGFLISGEVPLGPIRIILSPAPRLSVLVVDGKGDAVSGAKIVQLGLVPAAASRGADGFTMERARRVLVREFTADESGKASLGPFPGEQVLVATSGAACSRPWRGSAPSVVTLRLEATFTVGGSITLPDWSHLDYTGEQRLVVSLVRDQDAETLACLRAVEGGEWGPIAVPLVDGGEYDLRLEGSPIIPVHKEFPAPAAGVHLRFDLAAELGHDLWYVAKDEQGKVLFDAEVSCYYEQDGRTRSLRRRAREDDGFLNPWSFPAGAHVRSFISAPGYGGQWADELTVPEVNPETHSVVLFPGTTFAGRVTHEGKPIEDFEIVVWRPSHARFTHDTKSFHGKRDGRFEFDGAPAGNIAIAASTSTLPQCKPVFLTLPSELEVALELPASLIGRGEVVGLASNEPVPGAVVQAIAMTTEGPLRALGPSVRTDSEGRFELAGFAADGMNCVRIRAEPFSERTAFASAGPNGTVDFGRIAMFRPQSLDLQLVGNGAVEFDAFSASGSGEVALPSRRFDETGFLRYESVSPGRCVLRIEGPDFPWMEMLLWLEASKPWRFEPRVKGGRKLNVEVVAPEDGDMSQYYGLYVDYVSRAGIQTDWGFPMPSDGSLTMEGIDADSVVVCAPLKGSAGLDTAVVADLTEDGSLFARLELDSPTFTLRVVDRDGEPIPGVLVRLTDSRPTPLLLYKTTDEAGLCTFSGLPEREVSVHLDHDRFGRAYNRRVDARQGSAEVVLNGEATIALELRDGIEPAMGLQAKALVTRVGPRWTPLGLSDPSGTLTASGLGEGAYTISLDHPDYWPKTVEAVASPSPSPQAVQVRRRGSLMLQLSTTEGLPLQGIELQLRSVEFDCDVRSWIEQGLASGSLTTNIRGEALIERIPRGDYSLRFAVPGTDVQEGQCQVKGGQLLRVPIVVQ